MMFAKGARLALRRVASQDLMKGTEHLLTAKGRATLAAHYAKATDVAAVATACDVSLAHLDKAQFWADYNRPNDISYYEVNAPDNTLKLVQNPPSGYAHNVPRELVSEGEKRRFAATLQDLDLECARSTGVSVGLKVAAHDVPRAIQAGGLRGQQGTGGPDKPWKAGHATPDFVVVDVSSLDEAEQCVQAAEAAQPTMVLGSSVDTRGVRTDDAAPTQVGWDVRLILVPAKGVDVSTLAASPRVLGVVSPKPVALPCAVFVGDGDIVECVQAHP